MQSLVFDSEKTSVDSAEEREDARAQRDYNPVVVRISLKTRVRETATGSVATDRPMRIFPMTERKPMLAICSVVLRLV